MAKKEKKQSDKPSKGRSAFVHKLHADKTPKADALVKTQEKFDCPEGLFDRIWARSERGTEAPAKKKSVPPPKKDKPSADSGAAAS